MLADETNAFLMSKGKDILLILNSRGYKMNNLHSKIKSYVKGEKSLKKLNSNEPLNSIPISTEDIKEIKKELANYNVDFSVAKTSEKDVVNLYFKAKDITIINNALKDYANKNIKSLSQRIDKAKDISKEHNKTLSKDKNKDIDKNR